MIVDLFAGPGGWDEGLRMLGRTDVLGIEWEPNACATAEAAGHRRLQADTLADRMAAGDDSLNWCEWEDPRSSLVCQRCKLRGGTHYYLTEGRLQMHLAAHRTAGHDVPVVEL